MKTKISILSLIIMALFCSFLSSPRTAAPYAAASLCNLGISANPKFSYVASVDDLLKMDSLCLQNLPDYKVEKYSMVFMPVENYMTIIYLTGNTFDATGKKLISELKTGDIFIIDGISVINKKTGERKNLRPLSVKVS